MSGAHDAIGKNGHFPHEPPDFLAVFESSPDLQLILDPRFIIVAANDAYCRATVIKREDLVGRPVFDVFPDDPEDRNAQGVANLRVSLLNVIKFRQADRMPDRKCDVRRPDGLFEERHWSPLNSPVLGVDGYVRWIIHTVADITDLVHAREAESESRRRALEQEHAAADLRLSNAQLVERIALLNASLRQLAAVARE